MRKLALGLVTIILSVVVSIALLELAMRFLPVHGGSFLQPVNDATPYARLTANSNAQFSVGPNMIRDQKHRTNNAGFVSPVDYDRAEEPLLAVVGDSYVEALMVPSGQTVQDVLRDELSPGRRVYGFGISGSALPQYLMWARLAAEEYGADEVIILVVSTDFDESLMQYRRRSGFHFLRGDLDACDLSIARLDHEPGPLRPLVKNSALLRYLVFNMNILQNPILRDIVTFFRSLGQGGTTSADDGTKSGIVARDPSLEDALLRHSKCGVDWIVANADRVIGLPKSRIRFVVDGGRDQGHETITGAPRAYVDEMRAYFLEAARAAGYEALDLAPSFKRALAAGQGPFEPDGDSHWNAAAHALAARRVLKVWGDRWGYSGLPKD